MSEKKVFWDLKDNLSKRSIQARYYFVAPRLKNKIVLDLGCGPRKEANVFSKNARSVVASDISSEALAYAKRNFNRKNISYVAMDAVRIALQDSCVDTVVSLEVIEHIADYHMLLKEVRRVLKSGGQFIVSTPHKKPIEDKPGESVVNIFHLKEFTLNEFEGILNKYFKSVDLKGQTLRADVAGKFDTFKDMLRTLGILKLKYLLPIKARDFIYGRLQNIISPITGGMSRDKVTEADYDFSDNISESTNLIAICTKRY